MRKPVGVALAALLIALLAVAVGGSGIAGGKGNACPDSSHNPNGTPPNCGHAPPEPPPPPPPPPEPPPPPPPPTPPPPTPPPPTPPPGNCANADLVLLQAETKIVCLYFGDKSLIASNAADCPDADIAGQLNKVLGACVFLPPQEN